MAHTFKDVEQSDSRVSTSVICRSLASAIPSMAALEQVDLAPMREFFELLAEWEGKEVGRVDFNQG